MHNNGRRLIRSSDDHKYGSSIINPYVNARTKGMHFHKHPHRNNKGLLPPMFPIRHTFKSRDDQQSFVNRNPTSKSPNFLRTRKRFEAIATSKPFLKSMKKHHTHHGIKNLIHGAVHGLVHGIDKAASAAENALIGAGKYVSDAGQETKQFFYKHHLPVVGDVLNVADAAVGAVLSGPGYMIKDIHTQYKEDNSLGSYLATTLQAAGDVLSFAATGGNPIAVAAGGIVWDGAMQGVHAQLTQQSAFGEYEKMYYETLGHVAAAPFKKAANLFHSDGNQQGTATLEGGATHPHQQTINDIMNNQMSQSAGLENNQVTQHQQDVLDGRISNDELVIY